MGVMDWNDLPYDREMWRDFANAVINLGGSIIYGEFLEERVASQEGICTMECVMVVKVQWYLMHNKK